MSIEIFGKAPLLERLAASRELATQQRFDEWIAWLEEDPDQSAELANLLLDMRPYLGDHSSLLLQ